MRIGMATAAALRLLHEQLSSSKVLHQLGAIALILSLNVMPMQCQCRYIYIFLNVNLMPIDCQCQFRMSMWSVLFSQLLTWLSWTPSLLIKAFKAGLPGQN